MDYAYTMILSIEHKADENLVAEGFHGVWYGDAVSEPLVGSYRKTVEVG